MGPYGRLKLRVIDRRRVETGAPVTQQELRDIPTARDNAEILEALKKLG